MVVECALPNSGSVGDGTDDFLVKKLGRKGCKAKALGEGNMPRRDWRLCFSFGCAQVTIEFMAWG